LERERSPQKGEGGGAFNYGRNRTARRTRSRGVPPTLNQHVFRGKKKMKKNGPFEGVRKSHTQSGLHPKADWGRRGPRFVKGHKHFDGKKRERRRKESRKPRAKREESKKHNEYGKSPSKGLKEKEKPHIREGSRKIQLLVRRIGAPIDETRRISLILLKSKKIRLKKHEEGPSRPKGTIW